MKANRLRFEAWNGEMKANRLRFEAWNGDHTKCQMGAKSCSSCCISEMCEPEAPDAGKAVCPCQNDHQGETRRILAESNTDAACLSFAPQADDVGTE